MKMSSNLLSPVHIQKLGHTIDEIRCRALSSVYSKYNLQLVDETNTDISKQLLLKLLSWFEFELFPEEEKVLNLLLRIAQSSNFSTIVNEIGADSILEKLGKIEIKTDKALISTISEIKDQVLSVKRTNCARKSSSLVIDSLGADGGGDALDNSENKPLSEVGGVGDAKAITSVYSDGPGNASLLYLPWQSLVPNNLQVVMAIFDGLRYVDDAASILESAQFFKDIVLRDFPAEIFLQRPLLFKTFLELLKSPQREIRQPSLKCLLELVNCLEVRMITAMEPAIKGENWKKCEEKKEEFSFDGEETEALKKYQVSILEFGEMILEQTFSIINERTGSEELTLLINLISNTMRVLSKTKAALHKALSFFVSEIAKICGKIEYYTLLACYFSYVNKESDVPLSFRSEIVKSIGLPSLVLFFPNMHNLFLSRLLKFDEYQNTIRAFEESKRVCISMEAAAECSKMRFNFEHKLKYFQTFKNGLMSLEYHKNIIIIQDFLKMCLVRDCSKEEKRLRTDILLQLMFHSDEDICLATHREIHKLVNKYAGINTAVDIAADKLEFLYESEIWKDLLSFSLNSASEVRELCRQYFIIIFKSKHMSSDEIWSKLIESILPCMELLPLYAENSTPFGISLARFFDPSVADAFKVPFGEVLRGNLRLMFNKDLTINETAFKRLCWILESATDAAEKLPQISSLKGLHLSSVCAGVSPKDANFAHVSFSSLRALEEAFAVLRNDHAEPRMRRCALTQLESIVEDVSLHNDLLFGNRIALLIDILESSLIERDYRNYPDSVISITKILNTLAKRHASLRNELSTNDFVLINVTRSLLLFSADDCLRQNAVELLFLLLFSNQIKEVNANAPFRSQLSIANVVLQAIQVPLSVQIHGKNSLYSVISRKGELLANQQISRLLRVYWAGLWLGNVCTLVGLDVKDLQEDNFSPGLPDFLRLTAKDLTDLQSISPTHLMRNWLVLAQAATSHDRVSDCITKLTGLLTWIEMYNLLPECTVPVTTIGLKICNSLQDELKTLPWISTFERFLSVPPVSLEDEALLNQILLFITHLLKVFSDADLVSSISNLLISPTGVLSKLLKDIDSADHGIVGTELRRSVIQLVQDLIKLSLHNSDFSPQAWLIILQLLRDYLLHSCGEDQSNGASVSWTLALLSDVTGAWNWDYSPHIELYTDLVNAAMQVLCVFNSSLEPKESFLCANMVSNAMLVLVNTLSDGITSIKGWEKIWESAVRNSAERGQGDVNVNWIVSLSSHRDPFIRSAALTIISGFFASKSSYEVLIHEMALDIDIVWNCGLLILFDSEECALVREKAADLLTKVTGFGSKTDCRDFLAHLSSQHFYEHLISLISDLNNTTDPFSYNSVVTPSLITSVCKFQISVWMLNPTEVSQQFTDSGLLQALLRSVVMVENVNEEKVMMLMALVKIIRGCLSFSVAGRNIFLSTTNILDCLCAYIDPAFRESFTPLLVDSLWEEIFHLISIVLTKTKDGPNVIRKCLPLCVQPRFLKAILDSLRTTAAVEIASRCLITNLAAAADELSFLFSVELMKGGTFAILVCDAFLNKNLLEHADALTNLMCISTQAQTFALKHGLGEKILLECQQIAAKLRAHHIDDFRKSNSKKKIEVMLQNLESLYRLINNFCKKNNSVQHRLAECGLADAVHRLWLWYKLRPNLLVIILKMLCTFCEQSERACQSLALCSSPAGPRKQLVGLTLVHSVIRLVCTEMEQLRKDNDSTILAIGLQLLSNSCLALECRVILGKGEILTPIIKMLPSGDKKGRFGENITEIWLLFLKAFTSYPEGQMTVCQGKEAMEFILEAIKAKNEEHRTIALTILNHVALLPSNKVRLLATPSQLLSILLDVLQTYPEKDVRLAASMLWSLGANSQKGKLVLRSAGCDQALMESKNRCSGEKCIEVIDKAFEVLKNR